MCVRLYVGYRAQLADFTFLRIRLDFEFWFFAYRLWQRWRENLGGLRLCAVPGAGRHYYIAQARFLGF